MSEENGILEPDVSQPITEKKESDCGCNKNKVQRTETIVEEPSGTKNKVLFKILGVLVVGTLLYYVFKKKKVKLETE